MTAISDLDIFSRVARTGNMSAAGREMGLSPAVISKRVSLLEEKLGARLFHRTTRQLTLTEVGEGFFKRVVDVLSLIEGVSGSPPRGCFATLIKAVITTVKPRRADTPMA